MTEFEKKWMQEYRNQNGKCLDCGKKITPEEAALISRSLLIVCVDCHKKRLHPEFMIWDDVEALNDEKLRGSDGK